MTLIWSSVASLTAVSSVVTVRSQVLPSLSGPVSDVQAPSTVLSSTNAWATAFPSSYDEAPLLTSGTPESPNAYSASYSATSSGSRLSLIAEISPKQPGARLSSSDSTGPPVQRSPTFSGASTTTSSCSWVRAGPESSATSPPSPPPSVGFSMTLPSASTNTVSVSYTSGSPSSSPQPTASSAIRAREP